MEKFIKPAIRIIMAEYESSFDDTEIVENETDNSISLLFTHKKQQSEFKVTHSGTSSVKVEEIHNGLDSPENNVVVVELNMINRRDMKNFFEDFVLNFKGCI